MYINLLKLEERYEKFKTFIKEKSGTNFSSFDNKYIDEQENYKKQIYNKAIDILKITSWSEKDIGTGKIIDLLIKAIDLKTNNLLIHDDRRGKEARQDVSLLKAKEDSAYLNKYEQILFDFYKDKISDKEAFASILKMAGKNYPFLSYLFFLKSSRKYLPIAPVTFDNIFKELELEFRTSRKCSWDNYNNYLSILQKVQKFLILQEDIVTDVELLDAHSFLWMTEKQMKEWKQESPKKENKKGVIPYHEFILKNIEPNKRQIKVNLSKNNKIIKTKEDFSLEYKRKQAIGEESENIVLGYEIEKLKKLNKNNLVKKVSIVSNEVSLGYDILSFDEKEKEMHIEVKTVSYNNCFFITRNELRTLNNKQNYFIYAVNKNTREIFNIEYNQLDKDYTIIPENYKVYF